MLWTVIATVMYFNSVYPGWCLLDNNLNWDQPMQNLMDVPGIQKNFNWCKLCISQHVDLGVLKISWLRLYYNVYFFRILVILCYSILFILFNPLFSLIHLEPPTQLCWRLQFCLIEFTEYCTDFLDPPFCFVGDLFCLLGVFQCGECGQINLTKVRLSDCFTKMGLKWFY